MKMEFLWEDMPFILHNLRVYFNLCRVIRILGRITNCLPFILLTVVGWWIFRKRSTAC